jgi:thioredoxin reductase (NADPH)
MADVEDIYDLTIIGGGPTGLFAAFYAGFRELRTKIIEALPELGGQLVVLYPEKYIYDVPGFPEILAKDLARALITQGLTFNPTVVLEEQVQTIAYRPDNIIELGTNKGIKHLTRTVLICAGVGAFSPNKLALPSAARFEGNGVYYFVKDKTLFANKRLVVVGGGDSAMDWVLNLHPIAKSITLVHRRDVFRAHEASVKEVFGLGIEINLFWEIKEILGGDHVTGVIIFNNKTKEERTLACDAILINIGFKADLGPIKDWPLEFVGRDIKVDGRMQTSLPRVYAAGDVAADPNSVKLNLIVTGFAQAAIAVNCAKTAVDPRAQLFPGHSSEKMAHGPSGA